MEKKIRLQLQFIDSASLLQLIFENTNYKDDLIENKSLCYNKNY